MATKKITKKAEPNKTSKFDFSDSIKAIKETAKTVNAQVKEVTEEVVEDLLDNGEQLRDMTVAPIKGAYDKAFNKVSETVNFENLTKVTKKVNTYTLKTADELVDGVLENGEKWQGVATKAVKGSLKLAAKQQDIVFTTLETMKGQLTESAIRFRKLFSN